MLHWYVSAASELFDALKIYKDCTDGLNVMDVANNFFAGNDHRKQVFSTDFNRLINYVLTYSSFLQFLSNRSNSRYSNIIQLCCVFILACIERDRATP